MSIRLVDRFRVGDPVDVLLRVNDARGENETWCEGRVTSHAHPGVWVEAMGRRWFVTNGGRIRERGVAFGGVAVLYKIATQAEWDATQRAGAFPGSAADAKDGFIHLSTSSQVRETAARHFAGQKDLVLLDVAIDRLPAAALRWETSRGGALFPHLYGTLARDAVLQARPLPLGAGGGHAFPADVAP